MDSSFVVAVAVGYYRGVACFAAGCRNRKHHADRQAVLYFVAYAHIEVPHVAFVGGCHSYAFGRVDYTSSAYGKHEIYIFFFANPGSFKHFRQQRVGLHSPKLAYGDSGSVQRFAHCVIHSVALYRTAAGHQKHFPCTVFFYFFAYF